MAIAQTNDKVEKIKPIELDINDVSLIEGEALELDLKEDWQAKAAPAPKNRYKLMLMVEDGKFEVNVKQGFSKDDPNGKYYKKQVMLKIQLEGSEWNNYVFYYSAGSNISRGKKMSTMGGLLAMMGAKLPANLSELKLARLFYAIVQKNNPVLIADCDWSAWDTEAESRGDFGSALKVGMDNFPLVNGVRQHILSGSKGQECIAKLKVVKWIGKPGSVQATVSAPKGATTAAKAPVASVKAKPQVVEEVVNDDTDLGGVDLGEDGEVVLEL